MSNNIFSDDFIYVRKALESHPLLLNSDKREQFCNLVQNMENTIIDYNSLIDALTKATLFFNDGHTNIELPYTTEDLCLRIPCKWQKERLILMDNYRNIPAGAEIISVEGRQVSELLSFAETKIPHENTYLVKSRTTEYPYKNYHLFSAMNLELLFGKKEFYTITFSVNGECVEKQCSLVRYDGFLDFSQKPFIDYEIAEDRMILHLRECIYNEEYKQTLQKIAVICKEKKLSALELDLSENMGGNSQVIDEFIHFTHAESYRRYEMIDYSSGSPVCVTSRDTVVTNQRKDLLFPENIYCRVSNATFSSARTFAVTLKDNGIATIIGEPTGGKPCSYGMPKKDLTPNLKIRFRVSRALFLRPNAELDAEEALVPDKKEAESNY
ncbi:MAG: hypothetical protein J6C07_11780 [Lachnospiraceae bacterium]|nr:hypothetical protein [Lachnospiraceae bacterium]